MNIRLFLKRNSTNILTCIGCMGMVATTISAIKATSKTIKLIEKAEERKGETLTPLEMLCSGSCNRYRVNSLYYWG